MWVFLSNAFLSIVADRNDPGLLLVRGRREDDIPNAFPDAKMWVDPAADYRYRALVPRKEVAERLAEAALSVDYHKFKPSVTDHQRHDAYLSVWGVMYRYQTTERESDPALSESDPGSMNRYRENVALPESAEIDWDCWNYSKPTPPKRKGKSRV
jgi:hypothetical protein